MKLLQRLANKAQTPRPIVRKTASPGPLVANSKLVIELEDNTIASEDPSERGSCTRYSKGNDQRVTFDEGNNQVYDDAHYSDDESGYDSSISWYLKDELQKFRQDATDIGRLTKNHQTGGPHEAWARSIYQTYQSFCQVQSAHDMNVIYAAMSKPSPIDAQFVGLEAWAIPSLKSARDQRRQKLMGQVQRLQSCPDISKSERAKRIRKLSHDTGRPSRLLAMHLAQMVHA